MYLCCIFLFPTGELKIFEFQMACIIQKIMHRMNVSPQKKTRGWKKSQQQHLEVVSSVSCSSYLVSLKNGLGWFIYLIQAALVGS